MISCLPFPSFSRAIYALAEIFLQLVLTTSKNITRRGWSIDQSHNRENWSITAEFPLFAETTRSELASTHQLAEQFSVIAWVWQFNELRLGWSFKLRQLNQAITITLRLTEHANIFLNTYPVVVFSHFSLRPLFPCTRRQQCFTTATIRSFSHFENLALPLSLYCDVAFTRCK